MSHHLVNTTPEMAYIDRHELLRSLLSENEFRAQRQEMLESSTTIYVGNLSFFTREEQLMTHFATCGSIREIIMGLNETTQEPCGFCFIVYTSHKSALRAIHLLHRSLLDDRRISVGWDVGCELQRRWGRGAEGNQVVDGVRQNVDDGRGGLGVLRRSALGVTGSSTNSSLSHYRNNKATDYEQNKQTNVNTESMLLQSFNQINSPEERMCYYWVAPRRHKRSAPNRGVSPTLHKTKTDI